MTYPDFKLAIVGAGRWGFNHVRTAATLLDPDNIYVIDPDKNVKEKIASVNDKINCTNDIDFVLNNDKLNSVIVATPAETHYKITKLLLESGKNVLVEKPITLNLDEAHELTKIAKAKNRKLMVGHVLFYHPAVRKMKEGIDKGEIGKLQYIYSNRLNLGSIRSEENILWSFAPHDVSVIQYLTDSYPIEVFAKGADFVQNGIEDTTLTFLKYPDEIAAHIFVSWLHPFKEQRMIVVGEEGMYVFEDTLKTEKLKFYKKGFINKNGIIEKFESEYKAVELEEKLPLTEEHLHFYDCVINDKEPLTDGNHAYDVLKILVEATNSLKEKSISAKTE